MSDDSVMTCSYCDEILTEDECESPYQDKNGNVLCDDCYYRYFTFVCCMCKDFAPKAGRGNVGGLVLVVDEYEADMPVGIYEILGHPYFSSDMLSSWFNRHRVRRITDSTYGLTEKDTDGYAAGHFCPDCELKVKAMIESEVVKP